MSLWLVTVLALAYIAVLFAVAWRVDRGGETPALTQRWPLVYALSLGVFCTSWTFYGGVGTAATQGWTYLGIYLGPALVFLFCQPLLQRIVRIAREENTTSIADFISARYGKSRRVAALVTITAMLGAIPYVALQLKAIAMSATALTAPDVTLTAVAAPHDVTGIIAVSIALFTIMVGARRYDATGRNGGLVAALAVDSVVKFVALAAVGVFALAAINGAMAPAGRAGLAQLGEMFSARNLKIDFVTITVLSMAATIALTRMFYVGVVECRDPNHVRTARWPFSLYMTAMAAIALPIAALGLGVIGPRGPADLYVLLTPLSAGATWLALLAFIGGLSAALAMAVSTTVSLSVMVSNDLIAPLLLRSAAVARGADIGRLLLQVRRASILVMLALAWGYHRVTEQSGALATFGLIAFAGMAQVAPAMIGGVMWRRGTALAARISMTAGVGLWMYTLFLPSLLGDVENSPFALAFDGWLHPQALAHVSGLDPLTHGVMWSLGVNIALYLGLSLFAKPTAVEAPRLTPRFGRIATAGDLRAFAERFAGADATRAEFDAFAAVRGRTFKPSEPLTPDAARLAERLIAGVIGAPSARVIMGSALSGAALHVGDVVHLLDETSHELSFSREILTATMNTISQGVSVVDAELRLVAWNARYLEMFDFPPGLVAVGRPIADVIRHNAERGECGPGEVDAHVEKRLAAMRRNEPHTYERTRPNGMVLKTMGNPMPGGGYVTTFTDITAEKAAQAQLEAANERLEDRVAERTEELRIEAARNQKLAEELMVAKKAAEEAAMGKTKFLAAASHDLLQPLHAARLFSQALSDMLASAPEAKALSSKVDRSIAAADQLLRALLDISRLEAGGIRNNPTTFKVSALIDELAAELEPAAALRGLRLKTFTCDAHVRADRTLLRSILQNFLTNALRYTRSGGALIGVRRRGGRVRIEVWDTGPGIPDDMRAAIFQEFRRIDHPGTEKGAGLGLAIVERAARVMGAKLDLRSEVSKGSMFAVEIDAAAAPAPQRVAAKATEADLKGLRVLCVDNESAILEGLGALLRGWGCEPRLAPSYEEAVAAGAGAEIDAALVDLHLDGPETGIDILTALTPAKRGIKAAIITADPSADVARQARTLGASLVRKPVDPAQLRALLASARR
ncbi:MAG: PAS-domain containing protein [Alphaproteobacteria bacterium]|nr:PAS-domain containing protein [Alphaproteobacteria bacterium]